MAEMTENQERLPNEKGKHYLCSIENDTNI